MILCHYITMTLFVHHIMLVHYTLLLLDSLTTIKMYEMSDES